MLPAVRFWLLITVSTFLLPFFLQPPRTVLHNRLSTSLQARQINDSNLLETGRAARLRQVSANISQLKIISYNIRWRAGEDLRRMIQLFQNDSELGGATLFGLQEVDRNKRRTGNTNTAKLLAEELGMHYAWTAPPATQSEKEEETGVAILSVYPLSDIQRIVLPHEGPGHRRRVALGATITIGSVGLRFYSVHAETRIAVDQKIEQMKAVLEDLGRYPKTMPAVVMGDFNTWESSAVKKTNKLFTEASFKTPFDDSPTFLRHFLLVPIDLKLDWIWLRNLEMGNYGVDRKIDLSDHWPLWAVIQLNRVGFKKR